MNRFRHAFGPLSVVCLLLSGCVLTKNLPDEKHASFIPGLEGIYTVTQPHQQGNSNDNKQWKIVPGRKSNPRQYLLYTNNGNSAPTELRTYRFGDVVVFVIPIHDKSLPKPAYVPTKMIRTADGFRCLPLNIAQIRSSPLLRESLQLPASGNLAEATTQQLTEFLRLHASEDQIWDSKDFYSFHCTDNSKESAEEKTDRIYRDMVRCNRNLLTSLESVFNRADIAYALIDRNASSLAMDRTLFYVYLDACVKEFDRATVHQNASQELREAFQKIEAMHLVEKSNAFQLRHPEISFDESKRFVQSLGDGFFAAARAHQQPQNILEGTLSIAEAIAADTLPFDQIRMDAKHDAVAAMARKSTGVSFFGGIEHFLSERPAPAPQASTTRERHRQVSRSQLVKDIQRYADEGKIYGLLDLTDDVAKIVGRANRAREIRPFYDLTYQQCIDRLCDAYKKFDDQTRVVALAQLAIETGDQRLVKKLSALNNEKLKPALDRATYRRLMLKTGLLDNSLTKTTIAKVVPAINGDETFKNERLLKLMAGLHAAKYGFAPDALECLEKSVHCRGSARNEVKCLELQPRLVAAIAKLGHHDRLKSIVETIREPYFQIAALFALGNVTNDEGLLDQAIQLASKKRPEQNDLLLRLGTDLLYHGHSKLARRCLDAMDPQWSKDSRVGLHAAFAAKNKSGKELERARMIALSIPGKATSAIQTATVETAVGAWFGGAPASTWSVDSAAVNALPLSQRIQYRIRILQVDESNAF